MKIALDPGHGGMFTGAVGVLPKRVFEKDVTLAISLRLAEVLKSNGHRPILTRKNDNHLSTQLHADVEKRAVIANRAKADLFVSIHCNAFTDQHPEGIETWYASTSEKSHLVAHSIQQSLARNFPDHVNRGIKPRNILIFRHVKMPACHVETEFLTNPAQLEFLDSEANQERIAEAIGEGILNAFPKKKK